VSAHQVQFEERFHRYTVDGRFIPSVTQVLEAAGLIDLTGIPTHILRRLLNGRTASLSASWLRRRWRSGGRHWPGMTQGRRLRRS
jgi:hypothetical protein